MGQEKRFVDATIPVVGHLARFLWPEMHVYGLKRLVSAPTMRIFGQKRRVLGQMKAFARP